MTEIPVSLDSPAASGRTAYRAAATIDLQTGAGVEIAASSADSGLSALRRLRGALLDLGLITKADLLVVHDDDHRAPDAQTTTDGPAAE